MSKPVELRFSGHEADAIRAIAALERKYDNLEQKIKRGSEALKNQAKAGKDALGDQSSMLDGVVAKYITLAGALQLVGNEYQNMRERGKEALETQTGLQGSFEALAINTMGFPDFPLEKAMAEVARITKEHGVKGGQETTARAMSEAFNALGSLTPQEGAKAVETTMKLIPNMPLAHADVAAGILDIRNRRPDWTEEQAAGFMMKGMMHTRVATLPAFAQNAMPGILNMASLDNNDILGNAPILNALTHGSVDKFGRTSRTAGMAMMMQVREFFGREDTKDLSNVQLIDMLQKDETARKAFLYGGEHKGKKKFGLQHEIVGPDGEKYTMGDDRASFEKKAFASVEQLLTPGSSVDKTYRRFQREMGDQKDQGDQFGKVDASIDALSSGGVVQGKNKSDALVQSTKLSNTTDSRWAMVRESLQDNLKAAGVGWTDQFIAQRRLDSRYFAGFEPEESGEWAAKWARADVRDDPARSEETRRGTIGNLDKLVTLMQEMVIEQRRLGGQQPPLNRNGQGGN
jgi:hypothetical protein